MDIYDLGSRFAPGPSLNVEERAALEVQMAKRQHEERLHRCVLRERGRRLELALARGLLLLSLEQLLGRNSTRPVICML